jgi:squalene-hopene/tetraprenyl-beta-curcumene cyclase
MSSVRSTLRPGAFLVALAAVALLFQAPLHGQDKKSAPDPKQKVGPKGREQLTDAAVAYLKGAQSDDGTWSKASNPGITGLVLASLLHSGNVTANDPVATKALKFIESLVNEKEGHIAGNTGKIGQTNYLTAVNIHALKAAGLGGKYQSTIDKATQYLRRIQLDESEDMSPKDASYGGVGYGPNTRPDLSNTHFLLDALLDAGVAKSDPAFKKATVFVSRCQNLKGEHNDQPWAGKINDGSFIYVLAQGKGGAAKAPDEPKPGYGSMTFAGLKSLSDCGVSRDDPRFKKALEWVSKNYTVEMNPGRPTGAAQGGFYYYLATMSKCLKSVGIDEIVDADGKKHDWREDTVKTLASRQRKEGSWSNETPQWMESNPHVSTAFALEALYFSRPKGK